MRSGELLAQALITEKPERYTRAIQEDILPELITAAKVASGFTPAIFLGRRSLDRMVQLTASSEHFRDAHARHLQRITRIPGNAPARLPRLRAGLAGDAARKWSLFSKANRPGDSSLMKSKSSALQKLLTERRNRASAELDSKSALEIARIIHAEDAKVASAIKKALPQIARAIDMIAAQLRRGEAHLCRRRDQRPYSRWMRRNVPPTFNTDPDMVQFVMAGGTRALGAAVEANEDSRHLGRRDIAARQPRPKMQ